MSDAVLVTWHKRRSARHRPSLQIDARGLAALGALAIALLLLALAVIGMTRLQRAAVAPSGDAAAPEWVDVARPVRIVDLETPLLRGLPLIYSARRRTAGDGREDMLAYGTPGSGAPALRLRLNRGAAAAAGGIPLLAAIARQAAEAGLSVDRSGPSGHLPTRFGRFDVAAFTFSGASAARVRCDGFRLALDTPGFTISGLACGAPGKSVTRDALGCLLDRLDLASGGDNRAMIEFFAASERHRDMGCAGARLAPDGLHAAWLDDKPVTHGRTSRRH